MRKSLGKASIVLQRKRKIRNPQKLSCDARSALTCVLFKLETGVCERRAVPPGRGHSSARYGLVCANCYLLAHRLKYSRPRILDL
ncbi:hypothetical protein EVAR_41748_1 [Eumeta japonica]|uniref:Uncharacterized protein n=1 Tax=Eumeta variegata TaxID=151549 RepID=A0A4C1W017_EUMVA|nr:hypothetical protein EVAR_41748_1 [Eumeta japonica]